MPDIEFSNKSYWRLGQAFTVSSWERPPIMKLRLEQLNGEWFVFLAVIENKKLVRYVGSRLGLI